jgi:hypothetical protein
VHAFIKVEKTSAIDAATIVSRMRSAAIIVPNAVKSVIPGQGEAFRVTRLLAFTLLQRAGSEIVVTGGSLRTCIRRWSSAYVMRNQAGVVHDAWSQGEHPSTNF